MRRDETTVTGNREPHPEPRPSWKSRSGIEGLSRFHILDSDILNQDGQILSAVADGFDHRPSQLFEYALGDGVERVDFPEPQAPRDFFDFGDQGRGHALVAV